MKIKILGWDRVNARKDVSNPSWFKFKHKFFEDTEFYDFTHAEKCCWLYFLCEASKKNADGELLLSLPHAINVAGLNNLIINSTIKKLQRLGLVEVRTLRGRYARGTRTCSRQEEMRLEESREEERPTRPPPVAYGPSPGLEPLGEVLLERKVTEEVQRSWLLAYPEPPWVIATVRKALAWEAANPRNRKRDFGRFMTNWLARDWDKRPRQQESMDNWVPPEQRGENG